MIPGPPPVMTVKPARAGGRRCPIARSALASTACPASPLVGLLTPKHLPTDARTARLANEVWRGCGADYAARGGRWSGRGSLDVLLPGRAERNRQHGTGRGADDPLRHAAQQRAAQSRTAMGADHDEVDAVLAGIANNFVRRIPEEHRSDDVHAGPEAGAEVCQALRGTR